MSVRGLSTRLLRSTARRLALEPPGWLFSLGVADGLAVVRRELALSDPEELLGLTADAAWRGIAVVLPALTTTDLDATPTPRSPGPTEATVAYALDRRGRAHLSVRSGGTVQSLDAEAGVSGFVADAMARVLGLPTGPVAVSSSELVVRVWLQNLLDATADPATSTTMSSWTDALGVHPAWRVGSGRFVPPGPARPDHVAEATIALGHHLTWERMRDLAASGTIEVPGLAASTASWMDAAFFARWTLDVHRPSTELLDDLSLFLDGGLLRDVRYTVDAVRWLGFADSYAS